MPGVDPFAALAVNIATAPKTMAFFLGAGVSAAAGVPTGAEVLRDTCHKYYRAVRVDGGRAPTNDMFHPRLFQDSSGREV